MPGGLWVVATPIGNLADLSARARQALSEAQLILCEDTRRGAALLSALGLASPRLERFDAHCTPERLGRLVERLAEGESMALISDAGTPAISDPGSLLVAAARKAGIRITPIPGASAVVALLSAAGFGETAFAFRGFFPRKSGEQQKELRASAASAAAQVFVWFESPERVVASLAVLAAEFPDADTIVAKELTKVHERFFGGSAREAAAAVESEISREGARGEWCFAVRFAATDPGDTDSSDYVKALQCLAGAGVSASEAARQVSQHFGAPKKEVYERALRLFQKK